LSRTASGERLPGSGGLADIGIPVHGVAQDTAPGLVASENPDLALAVKGERRPRMPRVLPEERLELRAGLRVPPQGAVRVTQEKTGVGRAAVVRVLRQKGAEFCDGGSVALRGELRDRRREKLFWRTAGRRGDAPLQD
jgi:hypothetical protein